MILGIRRESYRMYENDVRTRSTYRWHDSALDLPSCWYDTYPYPCSASLYKHLWCV